MTHAVLGAIIPKIRGDMLAGQRLQRRRCDETARRFGHHDAHVGAVLYQQTANLGGLVCGDAACDSEQYASA
jgi:hypothetical protein